MPRSLMLLVVPSLAVALAATPGAAHAAPLTLSSPAAVTVAAGRPVAMKVTVDKSALECRVLVRRGGRTVRSSSWSEVTMTGMKWSWSVPSRARSLTWQLRAVCNTTAGARYVTSSLRVRGRPGGASSAVGRGFLLRSYGTPLRSVDDGDPVSSPGITPAPQPESTDPLGGGGRISLRWACWR